MVLNKKFQTQPTALASYNYTDIASGTGIVDFYAGKTVDLHRLSNISFYSDVVMTTYASASQLSDWTTAWDLDFDVEFIVPTTIGGKTVCVVPLGIYQVSPHGFARLRNTVTVKHVTATGTETTLATNLGTGIPLFAETATKYAYCLDSVDLNITQTQFKAGETLRLTMLGQAKQESPDAQSFVYLIAHDPKGRAKMYDGDETAGREVYTFGTAPTTLIFQVPLKLDL